jgi:hypothetical protein
VRAESGDTTRVMTSAGVKKCDRSQDIRPESCHTNIISMYNG